MTLHLFVLQPRVVMKARVNAPGAFVYPIMLLPYDTVSVGAYTDLRAGMTIALGTTDGETDLGVGRVRDGSSSFNVAVARSSHGRRDGEFDVQDNAYLTVWDDYRVWSRPPYINAAGVQYKDGDIVVGTWTLYPPPVANMRPGFAATIGVQGIANRIAVTFTGEESFAVADGASIASYFWDIQDGEFVLGTEETSEMIQVYFPAGFRWVALTVTDTHGHTHTARAPVFARDPDADETIQNFEIVNHRITHAGQQVSIRVLDPLPRAAYPDGTLVMLWDESVTIATAGRAHMQFLGWHYADPTQYRGERSGLRTETVLDCLDVAGRLDRLPGYTQLVEGFDTLAEGSPAYSVSHPPTTWSQSVNVTMDKLIHYILHWHSTALSLADFAPSGTGTTFALGSKDVDGATLWDQITRLAQAMTPDYHVTCNRAGQVALRPDPMLMPVGSRPTTVQETLTAAHWSEVQFTYTHPPRVNLLRTGALQAGFTANPTALFCIAPGTTWGQGESEQEISEKVVANQTSLNVSEGHRYARLNARYSRLRIVWARIWQPALDPADLTWVTVTLPPAQRQLSLTGVRGLVWEISIRYEHTRTGLARTVEMLWERETSGPPATSTNDLWVPL